MAKLTNILNNKTIEVEENNNEDLKRKAEEIGVPFGCEEGVCGTCRTEVVEGAENLTERNDRENELGVEEPYRLICQCQIKNGEVKIKN